MNGVSHGGARDVIVGGGMTEGEEGRSERVMGRERERKRDRGRKGEGGNEGEWNN